MTNHGGSQKQSQAESPPPDEAAEIRGQIVSQMALVGVTPETVGAEEHRQLVADAVRRQMAEQTSGKLSRANSPLSGLLMESERRRRELVAAGQPLYTPEDGREVCPHCDGARFVKMPRALGGTGVLMSDSAALRSVEGAMAAVRPCVCTLEVTDELRASLIARSGLPELQRAWTFERFRKVEGKEMARASVVAWAEETARGGTHSVLIVGGPGTGKSHLASAAVLALCSNGIGARYEYVPRLLAKLRPGGAYAEDADAWRALERCRALVLDDIGADQVKEWAEGQLNALIHERLHEQRATVITTDLTPAEIRATFGERLGSRLKEFSTVVVRGEDMRGR